MGKASQFATQKEEFLKLKSVMAGLMASTIKTDKPEQIVKFAEVLSRFCPANLITGKEWDVLTNEEKTRYLELAAQLLKYFLVIQLEVVPIVVPPIPTITPEPAAPTP